MNRISVGLVFGLLSKFRELTIQCACLMDFLFEQKKKKTNLSVKRSFSKDQLPTSKEKVGPN